MKWTCGVVVALILSLAAIAPAGAQTAPAVVKNVPDNALAFVVVKNLTDVSTKIAQIAKQLKIPTDQTPLDMLIKQAGFDKGLDRKGSALVVFVPSGVEGSPMPTAVAYLPVTDYKLFVESMGGKAGAPITGIECAQGKKFAVAKVGSHAALTETENEAVLKKALAAPSAGSALLAPVDAWVGDNDVSLVVLPKGVALYAEAARTGLGQAKDNLPLTPELQFVLGWIDGLESCLKTAKTDVTHLTFGARVDKAGNLDIGSQILVAKGSAWAKGGANAKAPATSVLAGLPTSPYVFATGGSLSPDTMKSMMNLSLEMMPAVYKDVPPAKLKKLETSMSTMMAGFRSMSMVMGAGKGAEPLFAGMVGLIKVDDADAYLKEYERFIVAYNDVAKDAKPIGDTPTPQMTVKQVKVDGKPALEVTTEIHAGDAAGDLGKQLMEFYFGPGGKMVVTQTALDDKTVVMRYAGPEKLLETIKTMRKANSDLATDADVVKTVDLLPAGSQWVVLLNASEIPNVVNQGIAALAPPGAAGMRVPAFPAVPPLGIGLKRSEAGFEFRMVTPAPLLGGVGDYIQQLRQLRGNISVEQVR